MADVSASLRGMRRLSCMAATGSHRCRLLLQNLQSPEQSASADSEYGNQFAHRLTLLVQAQQALLLARKEADRFHNDFVGTEHLLLSLIRLGQGVAVNVLQKLGLDLQIVRREVEQAVGVSRDRKFLYDIPYSPRVQKVVAFAVKEAKAARC